MAEQGPTVAIFGASGHLGKHIAQAFLASNTQKKFRNLYLFTRESSSISPEFKYWQHAGLAVIRSIPADPSGLTEQLAGVDIVVNAINSAGDELRKQVVQAIAGSDVKLYFPSEFGVDHTVHDFNHPEWDKKKAHFKLATKVLKDTKICRVYAGLFLEDSIGPWFGFDTKNGQYESYGSSEAKAAYTSLNDVGRVVASLSLKPLVDVPAQVHICGDLASMASIANMMKNKSGSEISIVEKPLKESKAEELRADRPDPSGCLRFLIGENKINHSVGQLGCDNELVNMKQHKWRWKTMSDLVEETGGRPWADATWT